MKKCENRQEQLSLFVADELDAAAEKEIRQHLESCEECSRQVTFLRGFRSRVADAERADLPADVLSRLTGALDEEKKKQESFLKGFQAKVAEAEAAEYPAEVHSRLTAMLAAEGEKAASVVGEEQKVVALQPRKASTRSVVTRYLAAAAVLLVCGLGVTRMTYDNSTPEAVTSLVAHHDTCWHIAPSEGRDAQFQAWVDKLGKMPPTPKVSSDLVAFDQRECPAGEVRAGHLLYNKGDQKVSVYILPAAEFTKSYGEELHDHTYDGRNVVLEKKGDWVYGVVAELPASELKQLVDTEHVALLRYFLAGRTEVWG